jgi:uncharacterized membrane protein YfcA
MSIASILVISFTLVSTSFLAGIFGMAGGMILMLVLLIYMPVPEAMMLHGVAQMTSNFWRALLWRRYVEWAIVARYGLGLLAAILLFAFVVFVPDRATVLIVLGTVPMVAMLVPARLAPKVDRPGGAELAGLSSAAIQLISGVSGPLLDLFFVRTVLDRRRVVASKAVCQTLTHATKLIYFGGIAGPASGAVQPALFILAAVLAMIGTSLSRIVLERLTDSQFRQWTRWIVFVLGAICLGQGIKLFLR